MNVVRIATQSYTNIRYSKWLTLSESMPIKGETPLADRNTKLQNFTKGENFDFSIFLISLHLMAEQALSNLIVCLMISHEIFAYQFHKRASMLQWTLGRFRFLQN